MAEELQHLIDRIQREAVDTGEQQAAKIVSQAREKAAALVKEAEQKAAAIVEQAKLDAGQYTARGQQALAQSARDLIITVGAGVEKVFRQLVSDGVDSALTEQNLQDLLVRVVDAFIKNGGNASSMEVLVSEADQAAMLTLFKQRFATAMEQGLQITVDPRTAKGFKVRLRDKHIEHDFSREAIADAVSVFLRPALAETVYKVSREQA